MFSVLHNKNLLFVCTVYCCQKGRFLASVLLVCMVSLMLVKDKCLRAELPCQGRYLLMPLGFTRTKE